MNRINFYFKKDFIMKKQLVLLLSIFFLTSPSVFAEGISDFEIEGMSIGDSLLDIYTEKKIIDSKRNYFETERQYYVIAISDYLETYDVVEIYLETNDKRFEIKTITGKFVIKNQKQCLDMKDDLTLDTKKLLKNKQHSDSVIPHIFDKSGKSKQHISHFNINGYLTHVRVKCVFWSEQIKNDYNYEDTLNVVAMDKEIAEWINDGYR
jgi:hypothetical protein